MNVRILYFAAARERAGTSSEALSLEGQVTVGKLVEKLVALHPSLGPLVPHLRVAVNREFSEDQSVVPDGAEVALIPPVAGGGGGLFKVVDRPLQLSEVVEAVNGPGQGGLVTFSGVVRDQSHGKHVLRLEYEAYGAMAEQRLAQIGQEAERRWPGTRVAIVHRTGLLTPGQLAVVIAASAPHRKEAFIACQFAIDRLKEDVPIWKKEHYEDGQVWVGLGP